MNIVLMGIQGCGKGTQGRLLAKHLNHPHISTGDIFRENITAGTKLGKKVQEFNNKGLLVPDEIVNDMVLARLERSDVKSGFILDGFPRNGVQLAAMEYLRPINRAILFELDDEVAIKRLCNRSECPKCNIIYGNNRPPKKNSMCDHCGGPLKGRADDKDSESVKRRLSLYHQEIDFLVQYYNWKKVLRRVDANGDVSSVFESLLKAVDAV